MLCHGVARKSGRGIPPSVFQEEVKNITQQRDVRGTVKSAALEGDPGCPNLVASSVYDTKPVHYLSMVSELVEYVIFIVTVIIIITTGNYKTIFYKEQ